MLNQNIPQYVARPFLKWAGGKAQLIQQYIRYFPENFQNYYEPFLGGGAIFFYLQPRRTQCLAPLWANLTDINPELINAYLCVRDKLDETIVILEQYQINHSKDYYYQVRSRLFTSDVEKAARFIYLNKTCFNGLYRENSHGKFNVPLGKYKNPQICNHELLRGASAALKQAQISVSGFEGVLNYAKSSADFVYFDPPYYPLSPTSNFTSYSRYAFRQEEQFLLRDVFGELATRGVNVMLSNSDSPFIREIYKDFNIHEILASRAINSNCLKRGKITELLVTSY